MTRVLVIGGTGFIGPYTVRDLALRGHEVAVLHRGQTGTELPDGVREILGDRASLPDLRLEWERLAPDVVVDVIAYTEAQARALVETFRGAAGRIVVLSSADVYRNYDGLRGRSSAPPDPLPLSEESPLREALYPYRGQDAPGEHSEDYEKILVERAVHDQADLPATVLRLPAVYGPGDTQHRLRAYLRQMDDGRPSIPLPDGQADWRWTRGYVENVGAAIALAASDERAAGQTYNLGDDRACTEREWVLQVGKVAGWAGEVVTARDGSSSASATQPLDWRYHLETDTRCIRDELGYREAVPREDAIEQTVRWERTLSSGRHP